MMLIFVMSAQAASESSQLSGGIVEKLIAAFFDKFGSMSAESQASITHTLTFVVRKAAHFLEYFVLGLLSYFTASTYKQFELKVRAVFSVLFCVLYAVSDEVHQYFVPGRACRFGDICIDAFGSMLAIILLTTIFYYKKRHKSVKKCVKNS